MLKSLRKVKRTLNLSLKVSPEELEAITEAAKKYAGGNLSAWIRFSGTQHRPKPADLEE